MKIDVPSLSCFTFSFSLAKINMNMNSDFAIIILHMWEVASLFILVRCSIFKHSRGSSKKLTIFSSFEVKLKTTRNVILLKRHEASEDCTKFILPARAVLSNKTQSTQQALRIIIVMIPIRYDFGLVDDVSLQLFLSVVQPTPMFHSVSLSILMSCYDSKAHKNSNNEGSTKFWVCHWR